MKKILMLTVAAMALSSASFAATMTASCGNVTYDGKQNATTLTTVNCSSFSVVTGLTIGVLPGQATFNSATLLYLMDNAKSLGGTYQDTLSFTSGIGGATQNATQSGYSFGDPGSGAIVVTGPTPFSTTQSGGFSITAATPIVTTPTVLGSSYSFSVTYDYNIVPSGVPEPSTVALIGAGLVGLASIARRRRS